MLTLGWALAGLFGALAGVLVTPSTFLYPNSMDSIFVLGFTAAVIGGLDSPVGAVIGGVLLGVVLSYAGGYLGSNLVLVYGLVALLLVLMIRPSGLFVQRGQPEGVTHDPRPPPGRRDRRRGDPPAAVPPAQLLPRLPDGRGRRVRGGRGRADRADRAERPDLDRERRLHGHRRLRLGAAADPPGLAAGGGVRGRGGDRRRGRRGVRRRRGPAARALPGRGHAHAGRALPTIANQYPKLFGGDQGLSVSIAYHRRSSGPRSRPLGGWPG